MPTAELQEWGQFLVGAADDGLDGLGALVTVLGEAPGDVADAGRIGFAAFGDLCGNGFHFGQRRLQRLDVLARQALGLVLQAAHALGQGLGDLGFFLGGGLAADDG